MSDAPQTPLPEEPHVEIHKPHAAKTWKEFFIELGTVILGILIAMSLEQAVENWREHRQYNEARRAMLDELAGDLANIMQRDKYEACTVKRMQEIDDILDRAESGTPFDPPSWIGYTASFRMRFVAEDESQKSALFTSAEQRAFGSPYSYFHSIDQEQDRERFAWDRLQMLKGKNKLSPEMIQSLREALADARFENDRIAFLVMFAKAWGGPIGLLETAGKSASVVATTFDKHPHCEPMNTPTALAERETAYRMPSSLAH